MAKLKITQVRSAIDRNVRQKRTIEALGLGKLHRTVMLNDTPQIRSMIKAVNHLVEYEKVDE